MSHFEAYNEIIQNRKQNPLLEELYGENHHIVPKSVCPVLAKSNENIVRLSAQEHFLAHYHLWLAYRDELKEKKWARKMCFALHRMKQQLMKCDDVEGMAKLYEDARISILSHLSEVHTGKAYFKGHHHTQETKQKISQANKCRDSKVYERISDKLTGIKRSEETRRKMSLAQKRNKVNVSAETRKKMSESHKKLPPPFLNKHHSEEYVQRMKDENAKRRWWNNGVISKFCEICPTGFVSGRISWKLKQHLTRG